MAALTLTALPGHHEQEPGRPYKSTVIELLGNCLGRNRIEAKSVAEITTLVKTFGDDVAQRHPDVSFLVSVSVVKGSRKPNGFDAANRCNGLGQESWMKTIDKAARSGRATPRPRSHQLHQPTREARHRAGLSCFWRQS